MGSTGAPVLKILRNANAPIGLVTCRQPFMRLLGSDAGGGKAGERKMIGADKGASPIPQRHGHGTSPMSSREPQHTPPKTLAMQSSRDMLEKLRREIDRLAGSIVRQEIVDHGLNAAMTGWHPRCGLPRRFGTDLSVAPYGCRPVNAEPVRCGGAVRAHPMKCRMEFRLGSEQRVCGQVSTPSG
jgi:hypothetical protein